MSKFYIDIEVDGEAVADLDGSDLADLAAAKRAAIHHLGELVKTMTTAGRHGASTIVRDKDRNEVAQIDMVIRIASAGS